LRTQFPALGDPTDHFAFLAVVYELARHYSFLFTWIINGLYYFQPGKSEWDGSDDPATSIEAVSQAQGANPQFVKQQILELKDVAYKEIDLVRLYDSLPPVKSEEILVGRTFDGKILRTNASVLDIAEWFAIRPLSYFGISWGKRYRTKHVGDPLLFNWAKKIYIPNPSCGSVGVCDITWRGVNTGTMSYDNQVWNDYFRILEHDPSTDRLVLLGAWVARAKVGGWFTLTWDPSTPTN